jgi:hypothetical protein
LSNENDEFGTGIQDSSGQWPGRPQVWSYSSLREAEECPRRWMLSRATYPRIWSRPGYPQRPTVPALLGDAVHRVLEFVLRGFRSRGCTSLADPSAVAVLKDLGGYSKLAERAIGELVDRLADNPRASQRLDGLRVALLAKVPTIRQRVQGLITRTCWQPAASAATSDPSSKRRAPLANGSHPEVEMRAPGLRLAGRADVITVVDGGCDITDYKTGAPNSHHADQLRTYALLWSRDSELNPAILPVRRLVLSYPSRDVDVDPPTAPELDDLAAQLSARIGEAETALHERPPAARPSPAMCRLCGVRQLCDAYWAGLGGLTAPRSTAQEPEWFDHEGTVISQNGPRSWVVTADAKGSTLLLRTPSESTVFPVGSRFRALNLMHGRDFDVPTPIGVVTNASEIFLLEDDS